MAQKKNKERKQNLVNYKNKIKKQMSEEKNVQEIPELRQYPVWKSQDTIEVSGLEWEAIYNLLNVFRQAVVAGESVMQRNTQNGKIVMKYVDKDGKEVSTEQVEQYTKQLQEYFARKAEEDAKATKSTGLVSETGETIPAPQEEAKNPLKAV